MIRADNLLKATFGTYWRMVKAAWPFLFFVYLPINMLAQAFVPADAETFLDLKNSFRVESILDAILGIVAVAAAVRFAAADCAGRKVTLRKLIDESLLCWGRLFKTNLLGGFIVGFLFLCLVVPGIVWMGFYAFSTGCVIIGGLKGMAALDESRKMVKGRWWRTVLSALALFALPAVVGVVFSFGLGVLADLLVSKAASFGATLGLSEEMLVSANWWAIMASEVFVGAVQDIITLFFDVGMAILYLRRRAELDSGRGGLPPNLMPLGLRKAVRTGDPIPEARLRV